MKIFIYKIISFSIFLIINACQFISGQSKEIILKDSAEVQQKDIVDVLQRLFTRQLRKETAGRFGLRIKINKYSNTYLCIDYGMRRSK